MSKKYKIFFCLYFFFAGRFGLIAQTVTPVPKPIAINNAIANTIASTTAYVNYSENKGQWYNGLLYKADFNGGQIFLEKNAFTYLFYPPGGLERLHPHADSNTKDVRSCTLTFQAVRMEFVNSQPTAVEGDDIKPFYFNYFLGNDSRKWASGTRAFGSINYTNLYQGISMKVFSDMSNVRYDFIIEPNANLSLLKMKFVGQNYLSVTEGQLIIHTEIGDIAQAKPIAYQEIEGAKVNVECNFVLKDDELGFEITGPYNASQPLIIDPTLVFATFSGSTTDNWGMSATYDVYSNAYTSGIAFGSKFASYPVTPGAFQGTFQGGGTGGGNHWGWPDSSGFDMVISKFNPTGTTLLYSTYLGGNDNEEPQSLVVDNANNLLVLGRSYSTNFPTTPGAFSNKSGGGADLTISKFDSSGTQLLASTYVGGSGDDGVNISALEDSLGSLKHNYADDGRGDIVVDNNNYVYVASCTKSTNFPTTPGAFQSGPKGLQDGCAFKMNGSLTKMIWSTYIGGSEDDAAYNIALNSKNEAYVAGGTASPDFTVTLGTVRPFYGGSIDGFVLHLSTSGALLESTFLGTAGYDQAYFVQTDRDNNVYVYGQTSGSYPITAGVYSNPNSGQFIHEMDPTLSTTIFSTEFGSGRGVSDIAPSAFLVDNCLNIYISGWGGDLYRYNGSSSSTIGLPVTSNAYRGTPNVCNTSYYTFNKSNGEDFYFMVLQREASALWYATFFGAATGGYPTGSLAHIDGGTSRFDKRGVIYQAICGGCGGYSDIPTTPGAWSNTNDGPNCNNALVKFQMDLLETVASFVVDPNITAGCAPFQVNFKNVTTYGKTYKWYFGNGDSSYAPSPTYSYTIPGTYTITLVATDSTTCNIIDTGYATVRVAPPVVLKAPSPYVCYGDSITLSASAPAATFFAWSPAAGLTDSTIADPRAGPLKTVEYYVTASDSFCSAKDTVIVHVDSNDTRVMPNSIRLCLGDTVILKTNGSYAIYNWSNGATTSTLNVVSGGTYFLATTDIHGCKGKDSADVIAFSKIPVTGKDTAICLNNVVHLYADSGDYKYSWLPPYGLNKYDIFDPIAKPYSTVTYTLTLTNGACISIDSNTITVKVTPFVRTTPDSMMVLPQQTVTLNATGTPPFLWTNTGELSCSVCASPSVKVDSNTVFYVQVADSDGCHSIDSVIVDVMPTIYVPDAFTPNGDGLNDIFRPKFTGYKSIEVKIFDRWGQLIYQWNTLDGGWDGRTANGVKVQEDTYVYLIKAVSYTNSVYQKIGSVTVIR